MKKILFLFVAAAMFFGCEKNSEKPEINAGLQVTLTHSNLKAAILSSHSGTMYNPGDQVQINWDFAPNFYDWSAKKIHIDLCRGDRRINRIASNVNFEDFGYLWTIPTTYFYEDLKIRIVNADNWRQEAFSDGNFEIVFTLPQDGVVDYTTRENLAHDYICRIWGRLIVRPIGHDVDPELYMYTKNYFPNELKPLYMFQKGSSDYHLVTDTYNDRYKYGFYTNKGIIAYVYKTKLYSELKPLYRYDQPGGDKFEYSVGLAYGNIANWPKVIIGYAYDSTLKE